RHRSRSPVVFAVFLPRPKRPPVFDKVGFVPKCRLTTQFASNASRPRRYQGGARFAVIYRLWPFSSRVGRRFRYVDLEYPSHYAASGFKPFRTAVTFSFFVTKSSPSANFSNAFLSITLAIIIGALSSAHAIASRSLYSNDVL